jgi:deoxyadenosine/deoxycytidine kinase
MFNNRNEQYKRFRSLKAGVYVIEGIIGVGKTTLGKSITKHLNEAGLNARFFPEYVNHTLLKQYIGNMERYAYTFQLFMLSKRIEIYRDAERYSRTGGIAIVDRSIAGDMTFARMQYENGHFTQSEWDTYMSILRQECQLEPSGTIYLNCSVDTAMDRIKIRGIESEVKGYTREYVSMLNDAYQKTFHSSDIKYLDLEWNDHQEQQDGYLPKDYVFEILDRIM